MTYNLSSYANIKKVINDNGYRIEKKLIVKKKDNLYLIKYNKKELTIANESTLGLFRSVITDGERIREFVQNQRGFSENRTMRALDRLASVGKLRSESKPTLFDF